MRVGVFIRVVRDFRELLDAGRADGQREDVVAAGFERNLEGQVLLLLVETAAGRGHKLIDDVDRTVELWGMMRRAEPTICGVYTAS